eukprot:Rhum_TRINITY_DN10741_c0_g2::Rhum_TRINITY_DN10741_c0_g2_i1::g.40196::m.40196
MPRRRVRQPRVEGVGAQRRAAARHAAAAPRTPPGQRVHEQVVPVRDAPQLVALVAAEAAGGDPLRHGSRRRLQVGGAERVDGATRGAHVVHRHAAVEGRRHLRRGTVHVLPDDRRPLVPRRNSTGRQAVPDVAAQTAVLLPRVRSLDVRHSRDQVEVADRCVVHLRNHEREVDRDFQRPSRHRRRAKGRNVHGTLVRVAGRTAARQARVAEPALHAHDSHRVLLHAEAQRRVRDLRRWPRDGHVQVRHAHAVVRRALRVVHHRAGVCDVLNRVACALVGHVRRQLPRGTRRDREGVGHTQPARLPRHRLCRRAAILVDDEACRRPVENAWGLVDLRVDRHAHVEGAGRHVVVVRHRARHRHFVRHSNVVCSSSRPEPQTKVMVLVGNAAPVDEVGVGNIENGPSAAGTDGGALRDCRTGVVDAAARASTGAAAERHTVGGDRVVVADAARDDQVRVALLQSSADGDAQPWVLEGGVHVAGVEGRSCADAGREENQASQRERREKHGARTRSHSAAERVGARSRCKWRVANEVQIL